MKKPLQILPFLLFIFLIQPKVFFGQVLEKVQPFPNAGQSGNEFVELNGKLYFTLTDSIISHPRIWVTDGTDTGTHIFFPTNNSQKLSPKFLHVYNNKLFFTAWMEGHSMQLWVYDENADSCSVLKYDSIVGGDIGITHYSELNNILYYHIDTRNIYGTDGTPNGTFQLTQGNGIFSGIEKYNNELYFSQYDTSGYELRKSNGSPLNVSLVKDIDPTNKHNIFICGVVNNKFLFYANDSIHGYELWATNGTGLGTYLIKDCNPKGDIQNLTYSNFHSIVADNSLYFIVNELDTILPCCGNTVNTYLWSTDGTAINTTKRDSINLHPGGYYEFDFFVMGNKLFFHKTLNGTDSFYVKQLDTGKFYNLTADCPNLPTLPLHQYFNYYNIGRYANEIDGRLYYSTPYTNGLVATDGSCMNTNIYNVNPNITAYIADRSQMYKFKNAIYLIANFDGTGLWRLRDVGLRNENVSAALSIDLYPIPAQKALQLDVRRNMEGSNLYYSITNMLGQSIATGMFTSTIALDVSAFTSGLYTLNVTNAIGEQWSRRFVKE